MNSLNNQNYEKYIVTLGNPGENFLSYSFRVAGKPNEEVTSHSDLGLDFQKYYIPKAIVLTQDQFNKIIDSRVDERVSELLAKQNSFRKISDAKAKLEVSEYMLSLKKKGVSQASLFDIARSLNLPIEQAERIMSKFVRMKKVKEL